MKKIFNLGTALALTAAVGCGSQVAEKSGTMEASPKVSTDVSRSLGDYELIDMIGYDGKTPSGESCRVFIASIWNCFFGDVGEYYLFASVTGNKRYKLSPSKSAGKLESFNYARGDYALAKSTEDKIETLNSLYEAGVELPESGELWACKELRKTEKRYNPFEDRQRCWGL